jgi:SOS-response transcriptional repressor LexA
MKKYNIEIKETLSRIVTVKASNEDFAVRIARDRYINEKIVLDSGDFVSVKINNIEL